MARTPLAKQAAAAHRRLVLCCQSCVCAHLGMTLLAAGLCLEQVPHHRGRVILGVLHRCHIYYEGFLDFLLVLGAEARR